MRKLSTLLALSVVIGMLVACGPTPATPTATTAPAAQDTPTAMAEPSPTEAEAVETPTEAMAADTPTAAATPAPPTATLPPGNPDVSLSAIKARGKLVVGVKYDIPTFGFLNPATNQVEGFDVEMGRAVAQRIFGNADAVEFKEAISRNRIPYLDAQVVDVVFSTMTANEDRAKQIDFTDCYYVAGQSLLVQTNSTITGIDSLAGKSIGTVKGSTSETNIRARAPQATVELFDTYSEAVQAMESGRVEAVTTDDIILFGFVKQNPTKFKVVGGQFTTEPYAGGVKKGNTELLNEVNAALREMKSGGKWAEAYKQWVSPDNVPPLPPQDWRDVAKMAQPTATP